MTETLITSPGNAAVKRIRRLRQRKEREEQGAFFVEGIRLVREAVELGARIETCLLAPDLLTSPFGWETVRRLEALGVPMLRVSAAVFASLSGKEGPQGIGLVVAQRWENLEDVRLGGELCWVALDRVQDPGNLGTVLRTSDAVGGAGVMLVGPGADPYDPSAVRASMGAVFSQRLVRTSPAAFRAWKEKSLALVVGTSDAAALDYHAASYPRPCVLFMGSEREGLSAEELATCDLVVAIPMVGRSDSLNLAVATGVMLYELFNQSR